MSLIDWSDPEEMLGLLVDYVADEASTAHDDPGRTAFLGALVEALDALDPAEDIRRALRDIREAQPDEFASDPVTAHLEDCLAELDRIARGE